MQTVTANVKMTPMKHIIIWTLAILVASCSSRTDKKDFEHNYEKYWDKYTDQQLIDTLLSDTSVIKTNPDWPDFKKFKFGRLKLEAYNRMTKLLNDNSK